MKSPKMSGEKTLFDPKPAQMPAAALFARLRCENLTVNETTFAQRAGLPGPESVRALEGPPPYNRDHVRRAIDYVRDRFIFNLKRKDPERRARTIRTLAAYCIAVGEEGKLLQKLISFAEQDCPKPLSAFRNPQLWRSIVRPLALEALQKTGGLLEETTYHLLRSSIVAHMGAKKSKKLKAAHPFTVRESTEASA